MCVKDRSAEQVGQTTAQRAPLLYHAGFRVGLSEVCSELRESPGTPVRKSYVPRGANHVVIVLIPGHHISDSFRRLKKLGSVNESVNPPAPFKHICKEASIFDSAKPTFRSIRTSFAKLVSIVSLSTRPCVQRWRPFLLLSA